jgi:hypothetical protein
MKGMKDMKTIFDMITGFARFTHTAAKFLFMCFILFIVLNLSAAAIVSPAGNNPAQYERQ